MTMISFLRELGASPLMGMWRYDIMLGENDGELVIWCMHNNLEHWSDGWVEYDDS